VVELQLAVGDKPSLSRS